jgi:hypothetical protein
VPSAGGIHAELLGGARHQMRPQFRRCVLDGDAAKLHRLRTGGDSLIGHDARVTRHDDEPLDVDVEFIRRELCEGGENALPDLDLAGQKPDLAALFQPQPGREFRIELQIARQ